MFLEDKKKPAYKQSAKRMELRKKERQNVEQIGEGNPGKVLCSECIFLFSAGDYE